MEPKRSFRFCPNCKAPLIWDEKSDPKKIFCSNCGYTLYLAPAIGNGIFILNSNDEVLLVRRKFEPHKGKWDTMGGFVDFDETLEESALRELKEELGIKVTGLAYLTSVFDRYLYKDIDYHILIVMFTARTDTVNIEPKDDITEAKFFAEDDIPWEDIGFPAIVKALKFLVDKMSD